MHPRPAMRGFSFYIECRRVAKELEPELLMQIVLPKVFVPFAVIDASINFFLLGPIKGGGNWQTQACEMIRDLNLETSVKIYVPCRWDKSHPLSKHFFKGPVDTASRQTDWERFFLDESGRRSRRGGCIIAWLPCESREFPRTDGQPYARDSYGEIGEWRGRLMHDPKLRFAIGAEEGFPGLSVMKRNFELALEERLTFQSTLNDTIREACRIAAVTSKK